MRTKESLEQLSSQQLFTDALEELQPLIKLSSLTDSEYELEHEEAKESYWSKVQILQLRATCIEWDYCHSLLTSKEIAERRLACDVLAQLKGEIFDQHYDTIITTLIALLDDDPMIIRSAGIGLSHQLKEEDYRAIPKLVSLATHEDADVRYAAVLGLSSFEHSDAISALLRLCEDEDFQVRNWATFGIGSQIATDTPEIRLALKRRLDDDDFEIRGEAFFGLAERKDESIKKQLKQELAREFEGTYAIESAGIFADPEFLPYLENIEKIYIDEMGTWQVEMLKEAILACHQNN